MLWKHHLKTWQFIFWFYRLFEIFISFLGLCFLNNLNHFGIWHVSAIVNHHFFETMSLFLQRLKAALQSQSIPSPVSKQAPSTQISHGYTTIKISPGVSHPPTTLQISPDAHISGIPHLSSCSVGELSPQSIDSIKSELPSPGAADSTVNM